MVVVGGFQSLLSINPTTFMDVLLLGLWLLLGCDNIKYRFQVSISSFNIKFQFQVKILSFNFKFQLQVSVSSFSLKPQFEASI